MSSPSAGSPRVSQSKVPVESGAPSSLSENNAASPPPPVASPAPPPPATVPGLVFASSRMEVLQAPGPSPASTSGSAVPTPPPPSPDASVPTAVPAPPAPSPARCVAYIISNTVFTATGVDRETGAPVATERAYAFINIPQLKEVLETLGFQVFVFVCLSAEQLEEVFMYIRGKGLVGYDFGVVVLSSHGFVTLGEGTGIMMGTDLVGARLSLLHPEEAVELARTPLLLCSQLCRVIATPAERQALEELVRRESSCVVHSSMPGSDAKIREAFIAMLAAPLDQPAARSIHGGDLLVSLTRGLKTIQAARDDIMRTVRDLFDEVLSTSAGGRVASANAASRASVSSPEPRLFASPTSLSSPFPPFGTPVPSESETAPPPRLQCIHGALASVRDVCQEIVELYGNLYRTLEVSEATASAAQPAQGPGIVQTCLQHLSALLSDANLSLVMDALVANDVTYRSDVYHRSLKSFTDSAVKWSEGDTTPSVAVSSFKSSWLGLRSEVNVAHMNLNAPKSSSSESSPKPTASADNSFEVQSAMAPEFHKQCMHVLVMFSAVTRRHPETLLCSLSALDGVWCYSGHGCDASTVWKLFWDDSSAVFNFSLVPCFNVAIQQFHLPEDLIALPHIGSRNMQFLVRFLGSFINDAGFLEVFSDQQGVEKLLAIIKLACEKFGDSNPVEGTLTGIDFRLRNDFTPPSEIHAYLLTLCCDILFRYAVVKGLEFMDDVTKVDPSLTSQPSSVIMDALQRLPNNFAIVKRVSGVSLSNFGCQTYILGILSAIVQLQQAIDEDNEHGQLSSPSRTVAASGGSGHSPSLFRGTFLTAMAVTCVLSSNKTYKQEFFAKFPGFDFGGLSMIVRGLKLWPELSTSEPFSDVSTPMWELALRSFLHQAPACSSPGKSPSLTQSSSPAGASFASLLFKLFHHTSERIIKFLESVNSALLVAGSQSTWLADSDVSLGDLSLNSERDLSPLTFVLMSELTSKASSASAFASTLLHPEYARETAKYVSDVLNLLRVTLTSKPNLHPVGPDWSWLLDYMRTIISLLDYSQRPHRNQNPSATLSQPNTFFRFLSEACTVFGVAGAGVGPHQSRAIGTGSRLHQVGDGLPVSARASESDSPCSTTLSEGGDAAGEPSLPPRACTPLCSLVTTLSSVTAEIVLLTTDKVAGSPNSTFSSKLYYRDLSSLGNLFCSLKQYVKIAESNVDSEFSRLQVHTSDSSSDSPGPSGFPQGRTPRPQNNQLEHPTLKLPPEAQTENDDETTVYQRVDGISESSDCSTESTLVIMTQSSQLSSAAPGAAASPSAATVSGSDEPSK